MFWWDWNAKRKLGLLAAIVIIAATPWLLLGWLPDQLGAFVGGTALLSIPQIFAWLLFVGLKTGRMPTAYGGSELRAEEPAWFWSTAALYGGVLLTFLWFALNVLAH
ncbi:hypothetical protein [Altererythrobacter sp.]|uniref:hypothetical protein n=1 Tax=Altererythrobacter sp. TaxID=1872480 RepID=UPI003D0D683F